MSDAVKSFDELLGAMPEAGPAVAVTVKALGGRTVYLRHPTSADADQWRKYCHTHKDDEAPMSAKLLAILLSDEDGRPIVPQGSKAIEELARRSPAAIDEIAKVAIPMINEPTEEEVEAEIKNS